MAERNFILSLVAGIFILIAGVMLLIPSLMIYSNPQAYANLASFMVGIPLSEASALAGSTSAIFLSLSILSIILGVLVLYGSWISQQKGKERLGGYLILIPSIISLFAGAGLIVGMVFGIIGGYLTIKEVPGRRRKR